MKLASCFFRLILCWLCLGLAACQSGYYLHLVKGHWALMQSAQPVSEWLQQADNEEALPEPLLERLSASQGMLDFAAHTLALPVGDAYREYAHLDRPWTVWNLFAAPEFSLEPEQWCYLVVGCAGYRGYFDKERAQSEIDELQERGLDVWQSGAIAYSTLGWFDDPLVTPMLQGGDMALAELLFHELVHRRFYVKGDTAFNESLATAVAREGVLLWLAGGKVVDDHQLQAFRRQMYLRHTNEQLFLEQVAQLRKSLEALYAAGLPEPRMREEKTRLQEQARQRFQSLLEQHSGLEPYQDWFMDELNNAQLASAGFYHKWVPVFSALIADCRSGEAMPQGRSLERSSAPDWSCFYHQVEQLADLPFDQRQQRLSAMVLRMK